MNKKEFTALMQYLMIYLSVKIPQNDLNKYFNILSRELSREELLRAIENLKNNWKAYGKEYPSISDFLNASKLTDDEIEVLANRAYEKAKRVAISHGAYISPDFEDILIANVIDTLGGWVEFHDSVAFIDRDDTFVRKDFIKLYKSLAKTRQVKNTKLVGRNVQIGYEDKRVAIKADYALPLVKEKRIENKKLNGLLSNLKEKTRITNEAH